MKGRPQNVHVSQYHQRRSVVVFASRYFSLNGMFFARLDRPESVRCVRFGDEVSRRERMYVRGSTSSVCWGYQPAQINRAGSSQRRRREHRGELMKVVLKTSMFPHTTSDGPPLCLHL